MGSIATTDGWVYCRGMDQPEVVEWGGRKWKRSPKSKHRNHRVYYVHAKWKSKEYLHRAIWTAAHGAIPLGWHVHHLDGDPFNNDVANLGCMSPSAHSSEHANEPARRELASRNIWKAQDAARAWHKSKEGKAWHSEHSREIWRNAVAVDLVCVVCGDNFRSKRRDALTCGPNCLARQRRDSGLDDITVTCPECGGLFVKNKYARVATCSRSCGKRWADRKRGLRVQPRR